MSVGATPSPPTATESPAQFQALFATWLTLDIPEGYQAEISQGAIRMNPPPAGRHNLIATLLHAKLQSEAPAGVAVFQTTGIIIEGAEALYIPDLVVAPMDALAENGTFSPTDVFLAVEITSPSNAHVDRNEKRRNYAAGAVPVYVLVDRVRAAGPAVTVYSTPLNAEYQHIVRQPFGEAIALPDPVNVTIDTDQFPTAPLRTR